MVKAAERAARTSVWLEGKVRRGGRGGQPSGLDRDRITEVGVVRVDANGLMIEALVLRTEGLEVNQPCNVTLSPDHLTLLK